MSFSLIRGKILMVIKKKGPISIAQLAKEVNISTGTAIQRYVQELKDRGLITTSVKSDRRGKPVMLEATAKAKPLSEETFDLIDKLFS